MFHKMFTISVCFLSLIFKMKDQKQKKFTKPVEFFWIDITKCYSFSETMAYFLALIVDSSTSY